MQAPKMKQRTNKDTAILELIPENRRSSKQKAFRPARDRLDLFPMYKLRHEPSNLDELDLENNTEMTIWRENETLICIGQDAHFQYKERSIRFGLDLTVDATCAIYGKTDAAIAETMTFFCSLKDPVGSDFRLEIGQYGSTCGPSFDFGALTAEQLAQILDANPARQLKVQVGAWSAEQTVAFATTPQPINLALTRDRWTKIYVDWKDGGTAFVDALEKRESSFGSFSIDFDEKEKPLSRANFKRLFNLEIFEKLSTRIEDEECVLLPFSTKVNTLDYTVDAKYVQPHDFGALSIVTKDVRFKLCFDKNDSDEHLISLLISFLNRVAELGHFERLALSLSIPEEDLLRGENRSEFKCEKVAPIVKALVGAIVANPKLSYLDLGDNPWLLDWNPHLESIFDNLDGHPGMRTFILKRFPTDDDESSEDEDFEDENSEDWDFEDQACLRSFRFDYSLLERLLSRNPNIIVLDSSGKRFSNGSNFDRLYSRNYFYRGSATLVTEPAPLRILLMTTALSTRATKNFQFTSVLLSHHLDVMCKFLEGLNEEESDVSLSALEAAVVPASMIPPESNRAHSPKREASAQSSHAAKKAARE